MIDIMSRASDTGDEKLYIEAAKCLGHLIAQHKGFLAEVAKYLGLFSLVLKCSKAMRRVEAAVCNVHLFAALMQVVDVTEGVHELLHTLVSYLESNVPSETMETIVFCLGRLLNSPGLGRLEKSDVRRLLAVRQKISANRGLAASFDKLILVKLSHAD